MSKHPPERGVRERSSKRALSTTLSFALTIAFILSVSSSAFANEGAIWYFGSNAGLDFNSGAPVALTDGALSTSEGCASLANEQGALLFYTDGITIYNRNHVAMLNGTGLTGDPSSSQSGIILPVINSPNQYYVFSVDDLYGNQDLVYSIVDMTGDGGLGGVLNKNTVIQANPQSEKIAIAQHANGVDRWLITVDLGATVLAYPITAAGVSNTPVSSPLMTTRLETQDVGYLRVSPTGDKLLATYHIEGVVELMDFDPVTGTATLIESFATGSAFDVYGAEFSPDGSLFYIGNISASTITQYETAASPVAASGVQVASGLGFGALALGPDRKIYATHNSTNLSVIENPDVKGVGATFSASAVDLAGRNARFGLPTIPTFLVIPPAVAVTNISTGDSVNDDTPTIEGTANPGNTVEVQILDSNGNVVQTLNPMVDANGNWTVDAGPLPEGDYTIVVTATNSEGDTATSDPVAVTIDLTAPGAVTFTAPAANSATNDDTPALVGTAEADASVEIQILDGNGAVIQTVTTTADASGNFTVDATALPDGDYLAEAAATDAAGNVGPTTPHLPFTVDTVPPAVGLDTPADSDLTNDDTPLLSGTGEDGAMLVVEVRDNGGNVVDTHTITVGATGMWMVEATSLADGDYTVTVTATDAAGNATALAPVPFTVDATPPALTLAAPGATSDDTPTIAGSTEANTSVRIEITDSAGNSVEVIDTTSDGAGDFSQDTASLADGGYTVTVTATDAAGNTSTASSPFIVDTTAPVVSLAPLGPTNDDTPAISGTTEANSLVEIVIRDANGNAVETLSTTSDASGNFSIDAAALADGTYSIDVNATDAAGNTGGANFPGLIIDTSAPPLSAMTDALTDDNTPNVNGSTEAGASVTIEILDGAGNTVQSFPAMVDGAGAFGVDAMMLADGSYTVRVTSQDAAGNETSTDIALEVDTTAPVVTLLTPGSATNDDTPAYSGTGEAGDAVVVTVVDGMGNVVETLMATVDAMGNWSVDGATSLVDGVYTATVTATDAAGNTGMLPGQNFTVDTIAPMPAVTSPVDGSSTANQRPGIAGTSEPGSSVEVTITDANGMVLLTETVEADAATGMWMLSMLTQDLPEGVHTIDVVATDDAGNSGSASSGFTVDLSVYPIEVTSPEMGSALATATPEVSGTTEPGAEVTIEVTDEAGDVIATGTVTADDQGDWSWTPESDLAEGTYTFEATVATPAGVESSASTTATIDLTAPTVSIETPADGATLNNPDITFAGSGSPGDTVEVVITDGDGNVVETLEVEIDEQGNWSVDTTDLPEGDYTIEVSATDDAGNSTSGDPITLTVDTTAPELSFSSPADGATIADGSVTFEGTGEPGDEVEVTITDDSGDVVVTVTVTVGEDGTWSADVPMELGDGSYTASATATDAAGNSSDPAEVSFDVDSMAPEVSVDEPLPETKDDLESFGGTGEPGTTVTVTVDGEEVATVVVGEDGTWTVTPTLPDEFDGDTVEVTVVATDAAGNVSEEITFPVQVTDTNSSSFTGGANDGCACGTVNEPSGEQPFAFLLLLGVVGLLRRRRN